MTIVPFRKYHLEQISDLEIQCFNQPWSKDMFEQELGNPLARYFVAQKGGLVIGYGGIWAVVDEGHITNIAVLPCHRHEGVGGALLDMLIDTAKGLKLKIIMLEVRKSNNTAINLYRNKGFFVAGSRKNYYPDNEDAILMNKVLE